MRTTTKVLSILLLVLSVAFVGCGGADKAAEKKTAEPFRIVTSFYPMYLATINITDGVNGVEVYNMTKPQTGCLHDYQLMTEDMKTLEKAEEVIGEIEVPEEVSDVVCEKCGRNMVVKQGRYGKFLACPGFPDCRNTKPLLKDTGVACPKCGGRIVERRSRRGQLFYGCERYPECDYVTWDQPLTDKCPECGGPMFRHRYKNGRMLPYCGNDACLSRVDHPINKEIEKSKARLEAKKAKEAALKEAASVGDGAAEGTAAEMKAAKAKTKAAGKTKAKTGTAKKKAAATEEKPAKAAKTTAKSTGTAKAVKPKNTKAKTAAKTKAAKASSAKTGTKKGTED